MQSELAADIAIAELTFVALSKGLYVASKTAEEFEVTSRPSRQTLKEVQDELAQAKRPLFTTPEGEAFEVAGIVEEEASSATSFAKDTQKGKEKLPGSAKVTNNEFAKAEQIAEEVTTINPKSVGELKEFISAKYDAQIIEESLQILKLTDENLGFRANALQQVEQMCKDLTKINSNPRWTRFKYDAAKNGNVTAGSIDEAIAGIACEEQGITSKFIRSDRLDGMVL